MLPAAAGPVLSFVLEKKRALLRLARKNCPDAVSKASGANILLLFSAFVPAKASCENACVHGTDAAAL